MGEPKYEQKKRRAHTLKANLPVIASIQCKYHICCVNNNYKFIWLAETWIEEERPAANSVKEFVPQNQWFFSLSFCVLSFALKIFNSNMDFCMTKRIFEISFVLFNVYYEAGSLNIGSNIQNHQFNEFPINEFSQPISQFVFHYGWDGVKQCKRFTFELSSAQRKD